MNERHERWKKEERKNERNNERMMKVKIRKKE